MARTKRIPKMLPTIWEASDDLWNIIHPILDVLDPPKPTGRPRTVPRLALNGIIYQMRTGCQWNVLPRRSGTQETAGYTLGLWRNVR